LKKVIPLVFTPNESRIEYEYAIEWIKFTQTHGCKSSDNKTAIGVFMLQTDGERHPHDIQHSVTLLSKEVFSEEFENKTSLIETHIHIIWLRCRSFEASRRALVKTQWRAGAAN
jgi:hypothetical protein